MKDEGARSEAGLCSRCRHCHVIKNARGSRFYLCKRAETEPRYRRYPPLPVLSCPGFEESSSWRTS